MRFEGTVSNWNDERGFGHIQPRQGGDLVFIHISAWPRGMGRPQLQQAVTFEVETGPKGKRAMNVLLARKNQEVQRSGKQGNAAWGGASLLVIPVFAIAYAMLVIIWRAPGWIAVAYGALSLVTFAVYAADKAAAVSGARRTPVATLHLLALAGGWPGALVAQQWLRHKSVKQEFRRVFWATVILNALGVLWLVSPFGRHLLPTSLLF